MTTMTSLDKTATLGWLRGISGELSTAVLQKLDESLKWYQTMPPSRRSAIGLVAQSGITAFINWYDDPDSETWIAADIFGAAPRELLRSVSLQQTLQLVRAVVEVVEARIVKDNDSLRDAFLEYSRDVAFAAADVYARAAEARGLWDARLEALVVDSILSGEYDDELPSRVSALGWHADGEVSVMVGKTPKVVDVDQMRRIARRHHADLLIGVQGSRLITVIGWANDVAVEDAGATADIEPTAAQPTLKPQLTHPTFSQLAVSLESMFGAGPLVLGTVVPSLVDANRSAKSALAGFAVVGAWKNAGRPTLADDLLPERALAGDPLAKATLVSTIYAPLAGHAPDLLATLSSYLENGRSLEATARELYVHSNTVRYRLKRVFDVIGYDPTGAREAIVLQTALILGAIGRPLARRPTSAARAARVHRPAVAK